MVKTMKEFRDEMRTLRREMYMYGETADSKLVASWLDRLVISMEKISPTLDIMSEELDQLSEAEPLAEMRRRKSSAKHNGRSMKHPRKAPAAKRSKSSKRGSAKKMKGHKAAKHKSSHRASKKKAPMKSSKKSRRKR